MKKYVDIIKFIVCVLILICLISALHSSVVCRFCHISVSGLVKLRSHYQSCHPLKKTDAKGDSNLQPSSNVKCQTYHVCGQCDYKTNQVRKYSLMTSRVCYRFVKILRLFWRNGVGIKTTSIWVTWFINVFLVIFLKSDSGWHA